MRYNSPAFQAWQQAEQLASEAERKLFAKLCDRDGTVPTREEVRNVRALREDASLQMKKMLDEMRTLAESLKYRSGDAGNAVGGRNGADHGPQS